MPARNTLVQLLSLYTNPESHNAQRHRRTEGMERKGKGKRRGRGRKLRKGERGGELCPAKNRSLPEPLTEAKNSISL